MWYHVGPVLYGHAKSTCHTTVQYFEIYISGYAILIIYETPTILRLFQSRFPRPVLLDVTCFFCLSPLPFQAAKDAHRASDRATAATDALAAEFVLGTNSKKGTEGDGRVTDEKLPPLAGAAFCGNPALFDEVYQKYRLLGRRWSYLEVSAPIRRCHAVGLK